MIEQTYFLDMIPGESAPPVVHVSQFDVNSRTLKFNLMKGGVAYEPDVGMTVTLDGTKPDNTAFSYPMTVDGSSVSIALQTQMTVVSGHVRCEVTVSNASGQIGSANFILAVEESAIDTGAISDTDIPIFEDLKNQAQQAAAEATAAAQTVSAILPENVGTVGQVLTNTGTGAKWDDVDGLPAGGTVGQVLTKQSSTDGDADWETPASGGTWGSITGTLSDQTDLQNALDAKSNIGNIATIETSPASANHAVGEFIVYNGQLYSVIDGITAGQALTPSKISATSAGAELTSLKAGLLWKAIATGVSSSVRVDHSPYSWEELLVVARINQTSYSILIPRNEYRAGQTLWSSGVYFREGVWVGVQFAFLGSTVYLAYANNSGIDVLSSTTYSVYWR